MELRKDYIEDKWVIINPVRGKRPHQFIEEKLHPKENSVDYFSPGNEKLTPPEIGRILDDDGKWKMRWFENKFPVVKEKGDSEVRTDNTYFTFSNAFGKHEVIVETNDKQQLWDLEEKDIKQLFEIYKNRLDELSQIPGIKYVSVFKNHGKGGNFYLAFS